MSRLQCPAGFVGHDRPTSSADMMWNSNSGVGYKVLQALVGMTDSLLVLVLK